MGVVYLAEDTRLDRQVTLKFLPDELQQDATARKRFLREAKSAAAIDHSYICAICEIGEAEGRDFIAMEFVQGQDLKEHLAEGSQPFGKAIQTAIEIAEALQVAHQNGIVHRDLKPANIMFTPQGHAKIMDFGLAKQLPHAVSNSQEESLTALTEQGYTLGTPAYMSPEQLKGQELDTRSDIFSFGLILYEMLTGTHPFRRPRPVETMGAILHEEPLPLSEHLAHSPHSLEVIVSKMLAQDPDRRFQTIDEVADRLSDLGSGALWEKPPARAGSQRRGRLVLLLAVVAIISLLGWWALKSWSSGVVPNPTRTIAVLPLANLSGDPEQEYFADGMTEALITDLGKIGALRVISRTSVMRYKGTSRSLAEIAEELNIDTLVEGSAQRVGHEAGITVRLIDAATERQLWSQSYRRNLNNLLALQSELARAIAQEIEVTLTPQEEHLLSRPQTVDPAAHEAYLKGRFHRDQFTPQNLDIAQQYFETAIEIDPDYAVAHFGNASVWGYRSVLGLVPPLEAAAKELIPLNRALELDDTLAEAHLGLANHESWFEWEWEAGEREFRRAIELNPNYAEARIFYSHFLTMLARPEEGREQADLALKLDPLNAFIQALSGVQLMMSERHEEAIAQFRKTLEMAPGLGFAHQPFWKVLNFKGRNEEALVQAKAHFTVVGEAEVVKALEQGYAEGGYTQAMRLGARTLADGSRTVLGRPMNVVSLYDAAGETELALEWLEKAYESHDIDMAYLGVLLLSEDLRGDPRFQEMMRKVKLPQASSP